MSCPCGLLKSEVIDLDQRDRVPLVGGRCQNPVARGDVICRKTDYTPTQKIKLDQHKE